MQMPRLLCYVLLVVLSLLSTSFAIEIEFPRCDCDGDGDGLWSLESILQCQKVSDFLIATAYFSIPLELLYFVSCSNFPFKWVLFQFGAFIVLCGLTHLLNVFTYEPHSFLLMLTLTISKFLTALVSFATAITLLTLIPQLLRVKVRENFLRAKARELDREVGLMKRQEATSWHVRMLTQEIRKSLDRHTILYTTLVELSKTLELQNCAVWMPNEDKSKMSLTHELRRRGIQLSVPISDPEVCEILGNQGAKILWSDSLLARSSCGGLSEPGAVTAIRMPMLRVSNFKGGTPEMIQACYAILVLVLPCDDPRDWNCNELEIVKVVADQVAVALSHAAVLEESQLMRDKLVEQNRALQQARTDALMASKARTLFQDAMSQWMRKPMHSISGLLSLMQQENLGSEQRFITDTMSKTGNVLATLINDIMESPTVDIDNLFLDIRPFHLPSMISAATTAAKSLCVYRGFAFTVDVSNGLPAFVVGDEKRILQVMMHMISTLLSRADEGIFAFHVQSERIADDTPDERWVPWRTNFPDGHTDVKFKIEIRRSHHNKSSTSSSSLTRRGRWLSSEGMETDLSYNMCKKLVQKMQGNIWTVPNSQGLVESMMLVLRFQLQSSSHNPQLEDSSNNFLPSCSFKGVNILLVDSDGINRTVTRKLLEKLDCHVHSVSSGSGCLNSLGGSGGHFDVVILDMDLPDMDCFDVALRIRKLRSGSWPLMLAMTAATQEEVWERCLQAGIMGLIQKPVMLQGIVDELRKVLHKT